MNGVIRGRKTYKSYFLKKDCSCLTFLSTSIKLKELFGTTLFSVFFEIHKTQSQVSSPPLQRKPFSYLFDFSSLSPTFFSFKNYQEFEKNFRRIFDEIQGTRRLVLKSLSPNQHLKKFPSNSSKAKSNYILVI